jgi:4-amino-4-deoxy-L-arabinose transferase-like glycosyltransferase
MKSLKFNLDLLIVAAVIAAFVIVAAQRLGTVPVPEGDEAFTLQVPYELMNHGKLALPMFRYLGGNIENTWHSYIPVYFVLLSGFHEIFGLGLEQGRAFNLMTAALTLLMVFLIGRRLFDWRAGLIAVVLLVGDPIFFERSRLLRDDFAAAFFALLAFYLYELAEEHSRQWLIVGAGLAAGAGVMSHTNMLYMIGAICLLILWKGGWRAFASSKLYLFVASALAVMAYEIVYVLIDYKNFLLQNRGDDVHFRLLSGGGLWQNLVEEITRYQKWFAGGLMFPDLPQTTLRIFQILTTLAIVYLLVVGLREFKRSNFATDTRAHLLTVIIVTVIFHAAIVSHKRVFYLAHIVPWFALAVGVMVRDAMNRVSRLRNGQSLRRNVFYRTATVLLSLTAVVYGSLLILQGYRYLIEVRNPNLASFEQFTQVIRDIIPPDVCPVAIKNPSIWLAFPEKDRCFATIENRSREEALTDIEGKEYALVTRPNSLPDRADDNGSSYHLLGEMLNTPYGNLIIYYTGSNPRYLAIEPKRYEFFGLLGGYTASEGGNRN